MKLRAPMMLLVFLMAGGVGLVAAQRFMPAQPNIEPSDTRTWKQVIVGERDVAADRSQGLIVMERMALKDGIVRVLVEGEITLEQAARRFLDLNKDNQTYFIGIECNYRNVDFNEAIYRDVLAWAESAYGKLPGYPSIRNRLEEQLDDCRQKGFPLPPRPPQVN
jgi:hypothetical protein